MRFAPGDTFDRYLIEALLGEGGMGEVYRANDTRLRRKVALKVLRQGEDEDSELWAHAVARMLREARAAAALSHPGAVAIYDVGQHEGTPFIAMELIEGRNLRALIGAGTPLGMRLRILLDVALALAAAHAQGLVHRDVKPENVMLREDGAVKVLDFGVARRVGSSDGPGSSSDVEVFSTTGEGLLMGTPTYMSPEQVRGEEIDARADQYAWGVVAYELLSGKLPHRTEKGAVSIIASILGDPPPPLPGVPKDVETIVHRTLAKEPDERFPSMDLVADALGAFVTSDPSAPVSIRSRNALGTTHRSVHAGPRSTRLAGKEPRAPRLVLIAGAALVVAAAGGALALALGLGRTEVPPPLARAAMPAPVPTPVTDLPVPHTDVPEALVAYREGMQAIRDASWSTAVVAFERARKADPSFAAAHMRAALAAMTIEPQTAREAYQKALLLRGSLGERDQALLDAYEPYVQREPPDHAEAARRLAALAVRYPGDAEILMHRIAMMKYEAPEAILPLLNRCIELDPKYADCWQTKAHALLQLGRAVEAHAALERCIDVAPGAIDCIHDRARFAMQDGRCRDLEEVARTWSAKEPAAGLPYHYLAVSLFAQGRPIPAVRAGLDQAARRYRALGQTDVVEIHEACFSLVSGDFAEAERRVQRIGDGQGELVGTASQARAVLLRLELYEETGRAAEGARYAEATSPRLDATTWLINPLSDPTVPLFAAMQRNGRMSRSDYEAERAAWFRGFDKRPSTDRAMAWATAYAAQARTAADGKDALSVLASLGSQSYHVPAGFSGLLEGLVGKVHWLVGDPRAALPHLEAASRDCGALVRPVFHYQNLLRLGEVREALGEKEGACTAYRAILARWGGATMSITAKEASKRAGALGCRREGAHR
ncbi:protein kinase domain-containing protein [Polyangium aurulentum]|uniref:serine/threonine-protein kinase n=1 Tax=Polyangium aurulentum TaxID=2567896 RepID=UPI0010AEE6AB|nr:serine/threonine-protein kinase [Polyangium aurulentum]UQA60873.1 protein kinase [Polyangium aurulentum]